MECINNGDIIITLAIQSHGIVTNVNLPIEIVNIFKDVRWFSKAGGYDITVSRPSEDLKINIELNELFTKDLAKPSIQIINDYIEVERPRYQRFLSDRTLLKKMANQLASIPEPTERQIEQSCRIFDNITVDKIFVTRGNPTGFFKCLTERLFDDNYGIFLISIHRKISDDEYKLIYPKRESHVKNMNLLDLSNIERLSGFFGTFRNIYNNIIPELKTMSRSLPNKQTYIEMENDVRKQTNLSEEQKEDEIERVRNEYYDLLNRWKIDIRENEIIGLKMSVLVKLIKDICEPNAKINLLDYSCNPTTPYLPKEDEPFKKYLSPLDLESGPLKTWGGKSISKKKTFRKYNRRTKSMVKKNSTRNLRIKRFRKIKF